LWNLLLNLLRLYESAPVQSEVYHLAIAFTLRHNPEATYISLFFSTPSLFSQRFQNRNFTVPLRLDGGLVNASRFGKSVMSGDRPMLAQATGFSLTHPSSIEPLA